MGIGSQWDNNSANERSDDNLAAFKSITICFSETQTYHVTSLDIVNLISELAPDVKINDDGDGGGKQIADAAIASSLMYSLRLPVISTRFKSKCRTLSDSDPY